MRILWHSAPAGCPPLVAQPPPAVFDRRSEGISPSKRGAGPNQASCIQAKRAPSARSPDNPPMVQPTAPLPLLLLMLIPTAFARLRPETPHPYYQISSKYTVHDPQFTRTVGNLLGPSLIPGNTVTTLVNGDQIFPAMLEAMRAAQKSITLETFIYWKGSIGKEFTDVLTQRAEGGRRKCTFSSTQSAAGRSTRTTSAR